jgi:hypothetical protein
MMEIYDNDVDDEDGGGVVFDVDVADDVVDVAADANNHNIDVVATISVAFNSVDGANDDIDDDDDDDDNDDNDDDYGGDGDDDDDDDDDDDHDDL